MNTSELKQLLIGTALIVALFIGLSSASEWAQASGANAPWYRVDFYADHYAPPPPTATPPPTSVLITTTGGGTLYSNDDASSVMVQFAPGAVSVDSYMSYAHQSELPTGVLGSVSRFFQLKARRVGDPSYLFYSPIFNSPLVTITVQYPAQNVMISGTEQLYWLDGTNWVTSGITLVRREPNFLQALTSHFSTFAVLGETNHIYLPLILRLDEPPLTPTPSPEDFEMIKTVMLTNEENGGYSQNGSVVSCGYGNMVYVEVLDINGGPLSGATIQDYEGYVNVISGEQYEPVFGYGNKLAEFALYKMGTEVHITNVRGQAVSSQNSLRVSTLDEEIPLQWLQQAHYCASETECMQRVATNMLCRGHYSFFITFRATRPF